MSTTKVKVLCSVFEHGKAYGKKGDTLEIPTEIAEAQAKGKKPNVKIISTETTESK